MPAPKLRPSCRTTTYRTRCPDCDATVFFMSCTCGSKVFFDSLEPDWREHADRCVPYLMRSLRRHPSTRELRRLVEFETLTRGLAPPEVHAQLVGAENRAAGRVRFELRPPGQDSITIVANLHAVQPADLRARLRLEGRLAEALLGRLASTPQTELRLRELPDRVTGVGGEYSAVVEAARAHLLLLERGQRLRVRLRPQRLRRAVAVWVVDALERL